ncbi:phage terminase small subunit [Novosphingobium sp. 9]|uniref:phage terminase small subunit n=1 Tax=Novosphingobium sp. 9 TaxID=2025349 RepID=UPI0021B69A8E|nr:phage terminase small subunit [Novosphingobium sp. 9]
MVSPFRRHKEMVKGLKSAGPNHVAHRRRPTAPAQQLDTPVGQEYAALRAVLHDNLRTLADIASIEARNPKKAEMAGTFAPWIEGVLAAGENGKAAQDEILVTNMIWALDYRDFDYALRLAAHVLRHNLILPERYKRTPACFLAEQVAELALAQQEAVDLRYLVGVLGMVAGSDMPDPVMAKLHKAIGRGFMRKAADFDPSADNAPAGGKAAYAEQALMHYRRAFELDTNVGVKKDIDAASRMLKGQIDAAPTDESAQT